jgi:hypothetical protein
MRKEKLGRSWKKHEKHITFWSQNITGKAYEDVGIDDRIILKVG